MLFLILSTTLIAISFLFLKSRLFLKNKIEGKFNPNSSVLSVYYGYCFLLWTAVLLLASFSLFYNQNFYLKTTILVFILSLCFLAVLYLSKKKFNAKKHIESSVLLIFKAATTTGILITIIITAVILFEAIKFFKITSLNQFLFGLTWNPQIAVHEGQSLTESSFGMIPVFLGTFLITIIAIAVAIPFGILAAIYLSEYANSKTRNILKPLLEILAGIPTVVYGYFAVTSVSPMLKNFFTNLGIKISSESALGAGIVIGIMIIPFILSVADDSISAVPKDLKDGSLALGSTKSETIRKVVLAAAFPGIISGVILAISRAIGETMIVAMAAGLVAKLSFNPLDSVSTATAQIVTLLVGDQESDNPKTLAAFALGLMLFLITLTLNIIALIIAKKYREKYE